MKNRSPIISFIATGITLLIGILTLAGWITNTEFLNSIVPGAVNMKFNAALGFVFASIVLLLNYLPGKNKILHFISILLSVSTFLIGLLTLTEYIAGINLGIDELFIRDIHPATVDYYPGRTSSLSAVNLLLIGTGLLLLNKKKALTYHYFYLTSITFACLLMLIVFNFLNDIPAFVRISTQGAIGFITLCIAIWFAQPMLQKKISFERRLFAGFTVVIILIAIISIFSSFYGNKVISTAEWVNHSNKVLSESEKTLSLMNDIESGGQGYLITGDSNYLAYFTIAKNTVFSHVNNIKKLTKKNAGQQARTDSLSALIEKRIAVTELGIRLINDKAFDQFNKQRVIHPGKFYSDKIRQVIASIQLEENNLHAIRQRENDKSIESFNIVFYVLMSSLFILLVIILFAINKNTAIRKKDEANIRFKAALLNTIGQAVIAINMDGIINFWNRAAEEIYGWTAAEAIGKNIEKITPSHQSKEQAHEIMEQLWQGRTWSGEFMVQRKDGLIFPVFVTDSPVFDQNQKVSGIIGVSFDITERKKSETAIINAYKEKNTVLERIDDGFFAVDKNSVITYWNKKAEMLLKAKKEDVIGKNLHEVFASTASPAFYNYYQNAISENRTVHFEEFSKRANKWFSVSAFASDNGLSVYFKDVTEQKNDEEKIKESELRYRSIIEQATDAICIADASMKIIDINLYGCQMLGYSKAEFMDLTINDLFLPEDLIANPFKIEELRSGKVIRNERRFKSKDGSLIEVEMSGRILADGRFIVFGHDIAERKKAQDKIKESELRYRSLHEQATDAICIADTSLKFIDINPYACEIFGYTREEALQLFLTDMLFTEDLTDNPLQVAALQLGKTIRNERRIKRKDGTAIDMEVSTKMHEDGRLFMFGHDITERKQAEQLVKESENRFRAMIEKSTDMKTLSTREGQMVYGSPSIRNVLGYSPEEFCQKSAFELIHPDDVREFTEKRNGILESEGNSFFNQNRLRHKNGNWIWCEGMVTNMLHEPGVRALVSNFRDISEKKIADQQKELDSINLNALINNTSDLMWSVDKDCRLINFNQPFFDIIRFVTGKELVKGNDVFSVALSPEQFERFKISYARALSGETFTEVEYIPAPDESWSEISYYPIRKGAEIIGTACHSRNITERKRAEVSLVQSEERYRQIVETAQEGIWLIDENNNTSFVNKKMADILEYAPEEMIGKPDYFFMDDEWKKKASDQIVSRELGSNENHEFKYITRSGKEVWTNISSNPVFGDAGIYKGALAMVTDITERKKSEDKIIESEAKYRSFFEYSTDGILLVTQEGEVLAANPAACLIFGRTEAEICLAGRSGILDITDPRAKLFIEERTRTGKATGTVTLIRKGVEKFQAEVSASVFTDANGEKKTSLIIRDITGKTVMEDLLDKATRMVRLGSWEVDLVKETVYFSAMTQEIHEVEPGYVPVLQTSINFYKKGKSRDKITQAIKDAIEKGKPWDEELQIITARGNEKWVRTIGEAEFVRGKAVRINGSFQDISERKLSEIQVYELNENLQTQTKELAISNAELEQFAYVASHDLQEPLRMVTSFLTQLEKKYGDIIDEKGKQYIWFAVDGAKRMRQIILDLLEFSRVGKTDDHVEDIDLNELIAEIQILFRKKIAEKKAVIIVDKLPKIHAHRSPMLQVFQNLIGNALKYGCEDTACKIQITASASDRDWQFAVTDNGIGIDKEYFDKIFIIFQRLHSKDEFEGTGMGLAVTKKIIENLGGKIWVESEEGKGSTFFFTIKK